MTIQQPYDKIASAIHLAMLIPLILLTSCATTYTGPSVTSYSMDISITSDPPNATITSVTSKSSSTYNLESTDYAHEKFGPGKHWIGRTPYRGNIDARAQTMPGGSIQTEWNSSANYGGGDTIMLMKTLQTRQEGVFYTAYHYTLTLQFMLELDGYEPELVSVIVAEGTYPYTDLLKHASAKPIVIHRVLKRI